MGKSCDLAETGVTKDLSVYGAEANTFSPLYMQDFSHNK